MTLLLLLLLSLSTGQVLASDNGLAYIGVGYNLLTANPDGENMGKGGIDPGILTTRKILAIPHGTHPPQVVITPKSTCASNAESHVFFDTKTYQQKLSHMVKAGGSGDIKKLEGFEFSLSHQYTSLRDESSKQHKVFFESQLVCNYGDVRYLDNLVKAKHFTVTDNFAAVVCGLPTSYSQSPYMSFLDQWGTHVVKEVAVGTRTIKRYQSSIKDFFEHVQSTSSNAVSLGGSYEGFGASMEMNYNTFKDSSSYSKQFGSEEFHLNRGSKSVPEPISVTIDPISSVLDSKYWQGLAKFHTNRLCPSSVSAHSLQLIQKNLHTALDHYAAYKKAKIASSMALKMPVTWPYGTYGLPESASGCPKGITWSHGTRTSRTYHHSSTVSLKGHFYDPNSHHTLRPQPGDNFIFSYCMKGDKSSTQYDLDWPKGNYCIFKYGECPSRMAVHPFQEGTLPAFEESGFLGHHGALPDGFQSQNQQFCCRADALPTERIVLPTSTPFFLFPYSRSCQLVWGMKVQEQWIDVYSRRYIKPSGAHPKVDDKKLHYCYYTPDHGSGTVIG